MWRVTAALWILIWTCTIFPIQVRIICTGVLACLQFISIFMKRFRLYRIERALIGNSSWYYFPFMCYIALLNMCIVFFAGVALHAVSAFNLWVYYISYRRADLCISVVLGITSYALERISWDHFFIYMRV
jgi:hypothetical protein